MTQELVIPPQCYVGHTGTICVDHNLGGTILGTAQPSIKAFSVHTTAAVVIHPLLLLYDTGRFRIKFSPKDLRDGRSQKKRNCVRHQHGALPGGNSPAQGNKQYRQTGDGKNGLRFQRLEAFPTTPSTRATTFNADRIIRDGNKIR